MRLADAMIPVGLALLPAAWFLLGLSPRLDGIEKDIQRIERERAVERAERIQLKAAWFMRRGDRRLDGGLVERTVTAVSAK